MSLVVKNPLALGRKPGQQPTYPVEIDWSHPLTTHLTHFIVSTRGGLYDYATKTWAESYNGAKWSPTGQLFDEVNDYSVFRNVTVNNGHSIITKIKAENNGGSFYQYFLSFGDLLTADTWNWYIHEESAPSPNNLRLTVGDVFQNIPDWYPSGNGKVLGASIGNTSVKLFSDGIETGEPLPITWTAGTTTRDLYIGARTDLNVDRFFGGGVEFVAIFNSKFLGSKEHEAYARDPYQIFKPVFSDIPLVTASTSPAVLVPSPMAWARKPGQQPQYPVEIDWSHPLARGLSHFVASHQGKFFDFVTKTHTQDYNGAKYTPQGQFFDEVNDYSILPNVALNSNHSIATRLSFTDNVSAGGSLYQYFLSYGTIGTANTFNGLLYEEGDGIWPNALSLRNGLGNYRFDYADWYPNKNGSVLGWSQSGTNYDIYTDGSSYGWAYEAGTADGIADGTVRDLHIGGRNDLQYQRFMGGQIPFVAIWGDRALSAEEHASFSRDPYQIFKPVFSEIPLVTSAAASVPVLAPALDWGRKPKQQPKVPVKVDTAHPLAKDLSLLLVAPHDYIPSAYSAGDIWNLVGEKSRASFFSNKAANYVRRDEFGTYLGFNASGRDQTALEIKGEAFIERHLAGAREFTHIIWWRQIGASSTDEDALMGAWGTRDSATFGSGYSLLRFKSNLNQINVQVKNAANTADTNFTAPTTIDATQWGVTVLTFNAGVQRVYHNGVLLGEQDAGAGYETIRTSLTGAGYFEAVGGHTVTLTFTDAPRIDWRMSAAADRAWTSEEVAAFSRDPYQIFKPILDVVPLATAGATIEQFNIPALSYAETLPAPTTTTSTALSMPVVSYAETLPAPAFTTTTALAVPTLSYGATLPVPVLTSGTTFAIPALAYTETLPAPDFTTATTLQFATVSYTQTLPAPAFTTSTALVIPAVSYTETLPAFSFVNGATFGIPAISYSESLPAPSFTTATALSYPALSYAESLPEPSFTTVTAYSMPSVSYTVTLPVLDVSAVSTEAMQVMAGDWNVRIASADWNVRVEAGDWAVRIEAGDWNVRVADADWAVRIEAGDWKYDA